MVSGFQASSTTHQGSLVASEKDLPGDLPSTVRSARWAFKVEPKDGWGAAGNGQEATAGWLAALPVFEPHWQVRGGRGRGTGRLPRPGAIGCSGETAMESVGVCW